MIEPTDAELWQLHMQMPGVHKNPIDFARAVLAKRGQPQAVAGGEPIGHLYCGGSYGDELADWEIVADQLACDKLNEHHGALGKEAKLPIYTASPPQAVREPLTDAQIEKLRLGQEYWQWGLSENVFRHAVRAVEAAHGITKGGQHGAE